MPPTVRTRSWSGSSQRAFAAQKEGQDVDIQPTRQTRSLSRSSQLSQRTKQQGLTRRNSAPVGSAAKGLGDAKSKSTSAGHVAKGLGNAKSKSTSSAATVLAHHEVSRRRLLLFMNRKICNDSEFVVQTDERLSRTSSSLMIHGCLKKQVFGLIFPVGWL